MQRGDRFAEHVPAGAGGQSSPSASVRISPLVESRWTDAERALAAEYGREGSAGDNGFATFLNHPELVKGMMPFLSYVSGQSTLSPRHREILILRTAWLCRSEYVWAHHAAAAAKKGGLSGDELRRIAEGPEARGWNGLEAALVRLADELHHTAVVSDATWRQVAASYDVAGQIDAVFAVAELTMIAGAFNSMGVPLEPRVERFPADVAYRVTVPGREPPLAAARITPVDMSQLTPEFRAIFDPTGSGKYVIGLYRTYARNPKLYPPRQRLSEYIRLKSTLSAHVRELLILRTGWLARAEYEWSQHVRQGRQAGLDSVRIAQGADAPGWDPIDATLVRAADELYRDDFISDATWNALAARFDSKALMDMLITAGGYRMVSMSINAFGVQLEAGAERFPEIAATP